MQFLVFHFGYFFELINKCSFKLQYLLSIFSWTLIRLAMVKLGIQNLKNFFPIAGLELTGLLHSGLDYEDHNMNFLYFRVIN